MNDLEGKETVPGNKSVIGLKCAISLSLTGVISVRTPQCQGLELQPVLALSAFKNLLKLNDLDLSHNQIQHFDPDYPLPIEKLDLSSNSITGIPDFGNLRNLKKLILDHNKIPALPEGAFDDLVTLEELSIKGNAIQVIPEHIFDLLENLRYLVLSANKIQKFPENSLDNVENLDKFDISNNNLRSIPQDFLNLLPPYVFLYNNPWHCDCDNVQYFREWIEIIDGNIYNSIEEPDSRSVVCLTPSIWKGTPIINFPVDQVCHVVTTEMITETSAVTEVSHMTTLQSYWLETSPPLEACVPYTDLQEKLDLSSNSITGIPDFGNLRNLKKLILDHNKIPALPEGAFDDLVTLEELSIKGNAIQVIPEHIFDLLENLRYLVLSANKIQKFPENSLDNVENLDKFDISNNNLRSIPQDFLNLLPPYVFLYNNPWHCDCDNVQYFREWIEIIDGNIYNSIGEPDSRSVVCLTPSIWKGTPIINFPVDQVCHVVTTEMITETSAVTEVSHMTTLQSYWLETSPPLEACVPYTDLQEKLDLSSNSITGIPDFGNLRNLKKLILDHNKIPALPEGAFDDLVTLEELSIKGNAIQVIPEHIFDLLENLRYLVLSANKIQKFPENSLDNVENLDKFDISNNNLRSIPQDFLNLLPPYVFLYNNPWHCDCDNVQYFREWIEIIDGNIYNSIGEPDSRSVVCLTPSIWKGTPIINFPVDQVCHVVTTEMITETSAVTEVSHMTTLQSYWLETSPPLEACVPYTDLQEKLDLSSNSITGIPDFGNLRNLKKLILDHNKIPALPEGAFDDLVTLEELSIKGNAIQVIPEHIFDLLENLRYLVLSANKIQKFPENSLDNVENLDKFDISNNNLRSIPQDFLNLLPPYVFLYNNPWHCDCDNVQYFREWIEIIDGNIYNSIGEPDSRSVVCLTPSIWKGTPIINFPVDQVCHVVTTEMITETSAVTEVSHMTTLQSYWLETSPPLEACVPYTDLQGKSGSNCSHQSLVSVPHSLPPETEILLLSFNNLTSVSLSAFKNLLKLNDLDLSHNQIQHFDPDYPLPIEKLDLSSNSITGIPDFGNLRNLKKLILDHNKIPALPEGAFDDLVTLEELSIKGNAIQVIPEHIFDLLENLRYLVLSANKIQKFPENSLDNVENLDKFDISNNNLRSIPQDFLNLLPPYVFLYNNPWHCDCDNVQYFREWIEIIDGNIYNSIGEPDSRSVVCLTPSIWKGTPIINFPVDQVCHVVTTEMITETSAVTEVSHMTTLQSYWLETSPPLEACVPYTDLQGKSGSNCSHQSLVSVPHSLPPETEILLLSFNNLTSVSLSAFKNLLKLNDLDLSHNQIQHFDPDYPLPIEKLDLSSNSLTTIPNFGNLRNLTKLILDHNKIPALPEGAFDDLVTLEELSIKGNAIQVIPEHIFDPLKNLRYLVLSANKIQKFPENSLDNVENLDKFDISNNNLQSIPQDFLKLLPPYVFLYNNPWHCDCDNVQYFREWIEIIDSNIYNSIGEPDSRSVVCLTPSIWKGTPIINFPVDQVCHVVTTEMITETPAVTEVSHMTTLQSYWLETSPPLEACVPYTDLQGKSGSNCSHQSLVSVPHSLPPETEILLLSFNNLTSVSLSAFKNLSNLNDLDLSHNQIQHQIDPDYPLPIEKLDLSSNSLTTIPNFGNLRNLTKLILDDNKISALPEGVFDDLATLEELSIKGNAIQVIPEHIFDPLENLRYLTLSANKIERIPNNSLINLRSLTTLDVSNNELRTVPQDFIERSALLCLNLDNNPWHCDCDIQHLTEWMKLKENEMHCDEGTINVTGAICSSPATMRRLPLIQLPLLEWCKASTPGYVALTFLGSPARQTISPTELRSTSPEVGIGHKGRRFGFLEALSEFGSICFLLFLLQCLLLGLLLLESCFLLLYAARFHRQCYMPTKRLAEGAFGIRLVRYSLLLPNFYQIYPFLIPDGELGGTEKLDSGQLLDPLSEGGGPLDQTEAPADAFGSFL
ncbi:uncharacterized protein LOC144671696 [Cetorhinus maximus]